ncbi:ABC transporter ATP-binding protein [Escherichia coli]|nr:ABC transporter ATP-binding protein [Escherichia coli]
MTLLGLESNLRERYPHQLSGGQQQRVEWRAHWLPIRKSY